MAWWHGDISNVFKLHFRPYQILSQMGLQVKELKYEPELSDVSDSELVAAAETGEKAFSDGSTSKVMSIFDVFAAAQA